MNGVNKKLWDLGNVVVNLRRSLKLQQVSNNTIILNELLELVNDMRMAMINSEDGLSTELKSSIFTFEAALVCIRKGRKVARKGWNASNQYVQIQEPDKHSKMGLPYCYLSNAQGKFVPWVPSQGDLFANDWYEVL